jgi:uncharacterized protein YndB with AHSA1/START domain
VAAARKPAARKAASRKPAARKPVVRKAVPKRPAVRKAPARAKRARREDDLGAKAMRLAGVGGDAVLKATGRAWEEWLRVLDRAGAKAMKHKDIALMVSRKFAIPGWWSQMVAVGYEQARGLRKPGQKAGGFAANASRTVGIPLDKLFAAWSEPVQRSRWLPDASLEVRRATEGKSLRMTWTPGGSSVDVNFYARGPGKSLVQIQHGKLPDTGAATRQKAYWGSALERLKAFLEGPR